MIRLLFLLVCFQIHALQHTVVLEECELEKLAMQYESKGNWPQALHYYLESFQLNPRRAEPLQKISSYYRHHGENELSYLFAKIGSALFSSYQFMEDLSIVSYYTGSSEDGFIAASDLMIHKEAPWWVKNQAAQNILFYVQNIPYSRFQRIRLDLKESSDEQFRPMNPSILKTVEGYHVICRAVNYIQTGAKIFHTLDPEGIYRTRNFLLIYDKNFQLLSQEEIEESLERTRFSPLSIVQGLEDCRIFQYENNDWFTCSTRDGNPAGVPQIVLCKIGKAGKVDQFIPLKGPDPNRCEKNWLPFIKEGQIQLIYSSDPFTVFRPNLTTGDCETVLAYQKSYDFSRFRGSAAPIFFDDGYLMLMHEVSLLADSSRVYLHRFVYLDAELKIKKISRPFTFTHQGVEFCCGMTMNHQDNELVMTIGLEDAEGGFVFLSKEEVQSMLRNL